MLLNSRWYLLAVLLSLNLSSCTQSGKPLAVGGKLPTNHNVVKDSTFSPNNLTAVNGSSITFVKNTSSALTIGSLDSNYFKPLKIKTGSSYFLKEETTGKIDFRCMTHPAVAGVIKFLP